MCGTLRLIPIVLLLSCSFGMRAYAQDRKPDSHEVKPKGPAQPPSEEAIDALMRRKGISRSEAERRLQEAWSPKATPTTSPNGKPSSFGPTKPKAMKHGLYDPASSQHPIAHVSWPNDTAKSESGDQVVNKQRPKAGDEKAPVGTKSPEDSEVQSEHHDGDLPCDQYPLDYRWACLANFNNASTGAK
jgi:hypothetical protein